MSTAAIRIPRESRNGEVGARADDFEMLSPDYVTSDVLSTVNCLSHCPFIIPKTMFLSLKAALSQLRLRRHGALVNTGMRLRGTFVHLLGNWDMHSTCSSLRACFHKSAYCCGPLNITGSPCTEVLFDLSRPKSSRAESNEPQVMRLPSTAEWSHSVQHHRASRKNGSLYDRTRSQKNYEGLKRQRHVAGALRNVDPSSVA